MQPLTRLSEHELMRRDRAMRAAARRILRNSHDAEEIAQETWLALLRSGARVHDVEAWVTRVVQYQAGRYRRRIRIGVGTLGTGWPMPPSNPELASLMAREAFEVMVLCLPETYHLVLALRYVECLSPPEIAARLGLSLNTIKCRLRRAHTLLRFRCPGR